MPVVAVINRKGGSGKSTLATHLAVYCANAGLPVMLGDVDPQQSTQTWLRRRGTQAHVSPTKIVGWSVEPRNALRAPAGITHVVLDTPGGLRGFELARVVMYADAILMPVCNSVFDRESAADCYAELMTLPRVSGGRCKVGAVGMRLDARTAADAVLKEWAQQLALPFVGVLRETQGYVKCIEQGLTLFDMPAAKVQADLVQWQPILDWLAPVLHDVPAAADAPKRPAKPATTATDPPPVSPEPTSRPGLNGEAGDAPRDPLHGIPAEPIARTGIATRLARWLGVR